MEGEILFAIVNRKGKYLYMTGRGDPYFYPELFDLDSVVTLYDDLETAREVIAHLGRRKGDRKITGLRVHAIRRILRDEGAVIHP